MTTDTLNPALAKPSRRRTTALELTAFREICEALAKVPAERRLAVIEAAAVMLGVTLK